MTYQLPASQTLTDNVLQKCQRNFINPDLPVLAIFNTANGILYWDGTFTPCDDGVHRNANLTNDYFSAWTGDIRDLLDHGFSLTRISNYINMTQ